MSAGVCGWSKKEGKVNGDLEKILFFFFFFLRRLCTLTNQNIL